MFGIFALAISPALDSGIKSKAGEARAYKFLLSVLRALLQDQGAVVPHIDSERQERHAGKQA